MKRPIITFIPASYRFMLASLALLLGIGTLFRLLLFILNYNLALHSDIADILYAFFNRGLLFDINVLAYIFVLPFLIVSIPFLGGFENRKYTLTANLLIITGGVALMFVSAIDLGYFKYYNSRITSAVFTWIEEFGVTAKVVLEEWDNLVLVVLFFLFAGIYSWLQLRVFRRFAGDPPPT